MSDDDDHGKDEDMMPEETDSVEPEISMAEVNKVFEDGPLLTEAELEHQRRTAQAAQRLSLLIAQGAPDVMVQSAQVDLEVLLAKRPRPEVVSNKPITAADVDAMTLTARKDKWFVQGMIPRTGVCILFGNSGSCKSWAVMTACLRGISETDGYWMGIEGARVLPIRSFAWIYGHEDLGGSDLDDDGDEVSVPISRLHGLVRKKDGDAVRYDRGEATNYSVHYCNGQDALLRTMTELAGRDEPPDVVVIDTVTSVVPEVMDMKNSEASAFYGRIKELTVAGKFLTIPIGHPRKNSNDSKKQRDPLHKDEFIGGMAVIGVATACVALHANKPEDADENDESAGIRVKVAKRSKQERIAGDLGREHRVFWNSKAQDFTWGGLASDAPTGAEERGMEILQALFMATDYTVPMRSLIEQVSEATGVGDKTVKRDLEMLDGGGLVSREGGPRNRTVSLTTKGVQNAREAFGDKG